MVHGTCKLFGVPLLGRHQELLDVGDDVPRMVVEAIADDRPSAAVEEEFLKVPADVVHLETLVV